LLTQGGISFFLKNPCSVNFFYTKISQGSAWVRTLASARPWHYQTLWNLSKW